MRALEITGGCMRAIIQRHNRLNGLTFSVIEFASVSLLVGTFATYYVLHHRAIMAIIFGGVALNCLPVVFYGLRELRYQRESGNRIGSFWDKHERERHKRENPHMLRDT